MSTSTLPSGRRTAARAARRFLSAVLGPVLVASLLGPGAAVAQTWSDPGRWAQVIGADRGAPADGRVLSTVLGVRDPVPPLWVGAVGADRAATSAWGWPLAGLPDVVHRFDPPEERWSAGHRGIDLAGVVGEPVLSVDAGVVAFSGVVAGVGVVSVDHASGLRSTYQPVADRVARGTRVGRGDHLGALDVGGHCVLRDCLHLGARRGRHHYVDPEPLLRPVTLSLLPVRPEGG